MLMNQFCPLVAVPIFFSVASGLVSIALSFFSSSSACSANRFESDSKVAGGSTSFTKEGTPASFTKEGTPSGPVLRLSIGTSCSGSGSPETEDLTRSRRLDRVADAVAVRLGAFCATLATRSGCLHRFLELGQVTGLGLGPRTTVRAGVTAKLNGLTALGLEPN